MGPTTKIRVVGTTNVVMILKPKLECVPRLEALRSDVTSLQTCQTHRPVMPKLDGRKPELLGTALGGIRTSLDDAIAFMSLDERLL